jgi:hypothetical protein
MKDGRQKSRAQQRAARAMAITCKSCSAPLPAERNRVIARCSWRESRRTCCCMNFSAGHAWDWGNCSGENSPPTLGILAIVLPAASVIKANQDTWFHYVYLFICGLAQRSPPTPPAFSFFVVLTPRTFTSRSEGCPAAQRVRQSARAIARVCLRTAPRCDVLLEGSYNQAWVHPVAGEMPVQISEALAVGSNVAA